MKPCALMVMALTSLTLVPMAASAQGSISGTATDRSGEVLPGVTVQVAGPGPAGASRSALTDRTGHYTITRLRRGTYVVTFTMPGFDPITRKDVRVPMQPLTTLDVEMKVGPPRETTTVVGRPRVKYIRDASEPRTRRSAGAVLLAQDANGRERGASDCVTTGKAPPYCVVQLSAVKRRGLEEC